MGLTFVRLGQVHLYIELLKSHLIGLADIVEFRKCTVIECPVKLTTGADLILSLSVYIKPSAFRPPKVTLDDKSKVMFNEGQETEAEQVLRERKRSLINLFKRINLKPRGHGAKSGSKLSQKELELLSQVPKPTQVKSSGNDEDDDGEGDISEEQINLIYKKCARNSRHANVL